MSDSTFLLRPFGSTVMTQSYIHRQVTRGLCAMDLGLGVPSLASAVPPTRKRAATGTQDERGASSSSSEVAALQKQVANLQRQMGLLTVQTLSNTQYIRKLRTTMWSCQIDAESSLVQLMTQTHNAYVEKAQELRGSGVAQEEIELELATPPDHQMNAILGWTLQMLSTEIGATDGEDVRRAKQSEEQRIQVFLEAVTKSGRPRALLSEYVPVAEFVCHFHKDRKKIEVIIAHPPLQEIWNDIVVARISKLRLYKRYTGKPPAGDTERRLQKWLESNMPAQRDGA